MFRRFIPFAFLLVVLSACTKNALDFEKLKDVKYDADIALPLAHGEFSIEDILKEDSTSFYKYDDEGLIWLTYTDELLSMSVKDLIPNNKTKYTFDRQLTQSESNSLATLNKLTLIYNEEVVLDNVNTNGIDVELDSIIIRKGVFDFDIENTVQHSVDFEISIAELTLNGVPYKKSVTIAAGGNSKVSIDVTGYKIDLTKGGTSNSRFNIDFRATITKGPSQNYTGGLNVEMNIKDDYGIEVAYGDVKRQDLLKLNKTNLDIDLFDLDEIGNSLFMEDALIKFLWTNSFGIPLDIVLDKIEGSDKTGQTHLLDVNNIAANDLLITAPMEVGKETSGDFSISSSNTQTGGGVLNLKEFINKNIVKLKVDAQALTNPPSITLPPYKNFVWGDSKFTLGIEAAIPLHGRAKNYQFKDTFAIEIGEDLDDIKSVSFKFYSENGFPVDFQTALTFVDKDYNVLFSIDKSPELYLKSAKVDGNGKATEATIHSTIIEIIEENIPLLEKVEHIVIAAKFSTSKNGDTPVKFYKDDRLKIKIGARLLIDTVLVD